MGKPSPSQQSPQKRQDGGYRDQAAPSSSSVLLDDIDYIEVDEGNDDLPAYDEVAPLVPPQSSNVPNNYIIPRPVSGPHVSQNATTISRMEDDHAANLENLVREEMKYPPQYHVRIHGTHWETRRDSDGKTKKRSITDFDVKLNMTHLLICRIPSHQKDPLLCFTGSQENQHPCRYITCLEKNEKGYRGGIFPSRTPEPSSSDPEHAVATSRVQEWIQSYTSSHHATRTFAFEKKVTHHNTGQLRDNIQRVVNSTGYRGHTQISFPVLQPKTIVFSKSWLNELRFNRWLCYFCYATFLWLLTWPIIWLAERKWRTITIVYPYTYLASSPSRAAIAVSQDTLLPGRLQPINQSEGAFFGDWERCFERAVLSRYQGWVDAEYRVETDRLMSQGDSMGANVLAAARGVQTVLGWGAHS